MWGRFVLVDLGTVLQVASYVAVAVLAVVVYEVLRSAVKRTLKRRMERNLREFLEQPDLYRQRFKFTNKLVIKHQLLADPEINEKIIEFAGREGEDIENVRAKVDRYIEEIVPSFNLFTYFRVGYPIARTVVHSLYDPVVDVERRRLMERLPDNASPVFVMNHRSNFDFVLLSYMLAAKVSISYAVGEWARVWPLEHLFKSFGSYFVRRGYKEDLYHKVLERYVQLIATQGVTQAVFPEGGLTRDGRLRPARLGLITWLSKLEADHDFKRDLVFVPVGVNYDWVLEHDHMVREAKGLRKETGFWRKVYVVVLGPFTVLGLLAVNGVRWATGRLKLHGYASLSFAQPLVLKDWMSERGVTFGACSEAERRSLIEAFGKDLIGRIGEAVPGTPVSLVAIAMLDDARDAWSFVDLVGACMAVRTELEQKGVRIVSGAAFTKFRHALLEHEGEALHVERAPGLDEVGAELVKHEETEALVSFALDVLRRSGIVQKRRRLYRLRAGREDHLRYYANSLAHRLGRDWPIARAEGAAPAEGTTSHAPSPPGTARPEPGP